MFARYYLIMKVIRLMVFDGSLVETCLAMEIDGCFGRGGEYFIEESRAAGSQIRAAAC